MGQEELEDGKVTDEGCLFMSKPLRRTGKEADERWREATGDELFLWLIIESVTRISVEEDLDLGWSAVLRLLLDSLALESITGLLLLFLLPFSLLREGCNGSDPIWLQVLANMARGLVLASIWKSFSENFHPFLGYIGSWRGTALKPHNAERCRAAPSLFQNNNKLLTKLEFWIFRRSHRFSRRVLRGILTSDEDETGVMISSGLIYGLLALNMLPGDAPTTFNLEVPPPVR